MRIAIITDETCRELAGFGTYTYNIVKNILEQDKENDYFLVHSRKEEHDIYSMAEEIIIPQGTFPLSALRNFVRMPLKLRKHDFDIVHHTSSVGPFAFRQFWPTKKGKAVETVHDIIPLLYPEYFEWPVRAAFSHLLPRIARNADKLLAVSEHTKNDIIKQFKIPASKIEVAYDGVNPIFKSLDKKKCMAQLEKYGIKEGFLLFVSTLEAKKNIPTALEAYAMLRKEGLLQKFVLVGKKGHGYGKVAEAVKRLQLESDVVMPGYVPLKELPLFYNAADVFVLPSLYEGFGIPAAEAMSCGCPVVASNAGALPEITGGAGKTVDVFDARGYASAIEGVLESKKTAAEMRRKGLKNAKRFSWKESAKKVIKIYQEPFCRK